MNAVARVKHTGETSWHLSTTFVDLNQVNTWFKIHHWIGEFGVLFSGYQVYYEDTGEVIACGERY